MNEYMIEANGWRYTVQVGADGRVIGIACKGRFPMTDPKWIGDAWLVADIQSRVDQLRGEEE